MNKITKREFSVRRWSLRGFPGTGKSTFAARMKGPQVVVDADGRFEEVVHLSNGDVFAAADSPSDNVEIKGIEKGLAKTMFKLKAATIIVDSVTEIMNPIIAKMMMGDLEGNGQMIKAMVMRRLSSAACRWGTDVLFIYHLYEGNVKGREQVSATISAVEQERLVRSLNMSLETAFDDQGGKMGIKVLWSRNGRAFPEVPILWDESGTWDGMPEAIEKAVYGNGKPQEIMFKNPREAQQWGINKGFYTTENVIDAYEAVKKKGNPTSAKMMWALWITHCRGRELKQ